VHARHDRETGVLRLFAIPISAPSLNFLVLEELAERVKVVASLGKVLHMHTY
jgi:hypothetical protein